MIEESLEAILTQFICAEVEKSGAKGVVLGLSGGIDSALSAYLAVRALGKDRVLALILPERNVTPESDLDDARMVADLLGIRFKEIDIVEIMKCYSNLLMLDSAPRIVSGNLKARIRMTLLYWHANLDNLLVLGTGNKTEIMLGYSTKYGDAAADILPLAGLYKGDVRSMARSMGVPTRILEKPPSAGLWPGQKDEEELGISYEAADSVLRSMEEELTALELVRIHGKKNALLVLEKVLRGQHKRELPHRPVLRQS